MKLIPFIFFLSISGSAMAQIEKNLDSILAVYVRENEPGIALQVEVNGKTAYKKAFGHADPVKGTKINSKTNFRMASVSKQFTAMCILLLEKEDRLSFDDAISKFLPELPGQVADRIQVRHLLTHSSGIIDYEAIMNDSSHEQLLDADVLQLLRDQDSTYFEPGAHFRYSNSGYALLAMIVERVSGVGFPEFMKRNIFKPLKMKDSQVYEASETISKRAMGYARDADKQLYANDQSSTSAVKGDGGVYTSLNDYHKWILALRENRLLNLPAVLKRLNFPIKESTGSYYGAGWFYFNQTQPALFHSGSTCGFSTFSISIPETKTSIHYFSNLAGNSKPFRKVLEYLQSEGLSEPAKIFELHELTR